MARRIAVVVLLLLILDPSAGAAIPALRPWIEVTVSGNPGVVLPREAAHDLVVADDIEGYWFPGEVWLTEAEDAVIAASADMDGKSVIDGYRQYAGSIRDAQRRIRVNSNCEACDGWREQAVLVMEGGMRFWQASYNATTG